MGAGGGFERGLELAESGAEDSENVTLPVTESCLGPLVGNVVQLERLKTIAIDVHRVSFQRCGTEDPRVAKSIS